MKDLSSSLVKIPKLSRIDDSFSLPQVMNIRENRHIINSMRSQEHIPASQANQNKMSFFTGSTAQISSQLAMTRDYYLPELVKQMKENQSIGIPKRIFNDKTDIQPSILINNLVNNDVKEGENSSRKTAPFSLWDTNLRNYYNIYYGEKFDLVDIDFRIKIFLTLIELYIRPNKIYKALLLSRPQNLNEALDNIFIGENNLWRHKFITKDQAEAGVKKNLDCHKCNEKDRSNLMKINIKRLKRIEILRNGIVLSNIHIESIIQHSIESRILPNPQILLRFIIDDNGELAYLEDFSEYVDVIENKADEKNQNNKDNADANIADLCYLCNDKIEKHSTDFNLELLNNFVSSKPSQVIYKGRPEHVDKIKSKDLSLKASSIYCLICFEENKKNYLHGIYKCNHNICDECYLNYLNIVLKFYPSEINCQVYKCPCKIDLQSLMLYDNTLDLTYYFQKSEKRKDFHLKKRLYCPKCTTSIPSEYEFEDEDIRCNRCHQYICKKCFRFRHKKYTCANLLKRRYFKYSRCQEIQSCPNCFTSTYKCKFCYKMQCQNCYYSFCFFCREFCNSNHVPNFEKCLLKGTMNGGFKNFYTKQCSLSAIFLNLCIFLLLIIISPLFAIIFIPHLIANNFRSKYLFKVEDQKFATHFQKKGLADQSKSFTSEALLLHPINLEMESKYNLISNLIYFWCFILALCLSPLFLCLIDLFLLCVFIASIACLKSPYENSHVVNFRRIVV